MITFYLQGYIPSPCLFSLYAELFSCLVVSTLCDPIDCSTPSFPVLHHFLEFAQTHVHRVGDAIQSSSTPSPCVTGEKAKSASKTTYPEAPWQFQSISESVQLFSLVQLFVTPWTAARQASPSTGACSNSCPSSWWCHPTISSSVVPFSSRLQSFPAQGLFQWVSSLH